MNEKDYDLRFINYLGFSTEKVSDNVWNIFDECGKLVGFINRSIFYIGDKIESGYETNIKDERITYFGRQCKGLNNMNENHTFSVTDDLGITRGIELFIGDEPEIYVIDDEYGRSSFKIRSYGLVGRFKREAEDFNFVEAMTINLNDANPVYHYRSVKFSKVWPLNTPDTQRFPCSYLFNVDKVNENGRECFRTEENRYMGKYICDSSVQVSHGSLEEVLTNNSLAIDAVNNYREYLGRIIPFENDILYTVFGQTPYIFDKDIAFLLPDIVKERQVLGQEVTKQKKGK